MDMNTGEMNDSQVCDDGDLRRLCSLSEAECGMCGKCSSGSGFGGRVVATVVSMMFMPV